MGEVSLVFKRSLTSTKPTKPGKKVPLSPFDSLMEKHSVKMVHYYSTPEGFSCDEEYRRRLRESMSEVLSYFHIATGRLMKDEDEKWVVKCNDAGLRMVEAKAKGSLENWLQNVNEENEMSLVDWDPVFRIPYYWATFYLKVTEFEKGGMAVAVSCSHLLADPLSVSTFIKAWADMVLYGKLLAPPFFHPLPLPPSGHKARLNTFLINQYKSILESSSPSPSPSPSTPQKSHTISLLFTNEMVKACMSLAQLTNEPSSAPFTALAGLLWTCISRVKGGKNSLIDMSLCFDVRKILGLDKGYFGNCMVYSTLNGKSMGHVDESLGAIGLIGKSIERVNKEEIMDLIEWLKSNSLILSPEGNPVIMNLENMDLDSSLFVEGSELVRVSCYVEPYIGNNNVLVLPSNPRDGMLSRVVMVTLPDDEVFKLCEDKLLGRFSPTIQMSPKYNF